MAGLIRREDIATVREQTKIEDIVGEHVTLRSAGVGSMKGLCPFHDERSPSFHVRPHLGLWHCFGCGEGGDVINFIQRVDHLDFAEAVEYLASRAGMTLRYEKGGQKRRSEDTGKRQRLFEANRAAEEFYREQLNGSDAAVGRQFLSERGFDRAMAEKFSLGFAPTGWDNLTRHLRSRGFTEDEITSSGLATPGQRGIYDRFRNRLIWPIRDLTGATVGFGARRMGDDPDSPKYLNTPETPIYHKAQVLYGLDLAKRDIVRRRRIVIVEGYTDVMAAHAAGETTAVATCGTAFGADHVQIVRRLLGDNADPAAGVVLSSGRSLGGEIIFTFDGDEAGRNAARKAYMEDQKFAAQTFVAVDPGGMDPCDIRLIKGDQAIRELIDSRVPLFEFVLRSVLSELNLNTAEGRVAGLRAASSILAGIKDQALRFEYTRVAAGWLGTEVAHLVSEVRKAERQKPVAPARHNGEEHETAPSTRGNALHGLEMLYRSDPIARTEREALEALLQRPLDVIGSGIEEIDSDLFTVPLHQVIFESVQVAGGLDSYIEFLGQAEAEKGVGEESVNLAVRRWNEAIRSESEPAVAEAITQLAVSALPQDLAEGLRDYSRGIIRAAIRMNLTRKTVQLRARLQRTNAEDPAYEELFAELTAVEMRRRQFKEDDT